MPQIAREARDYRRPEADDAWPPLRARSIDRAGLKTRPTWARWPSRSDPREGAAPPAEK
jgi:hypothetical protein